MEWFGWLTKGRMEVSVADQLIALGEFLMLVVVGVLAWSFYNYLNKFCKKRRWK